MPYIKIIDQKEASGELKVVYDRINSERGKLSNIMKIHSLLPDTMIKHLELYTSIMFSKNNLTREEKEVIAVVVSKINKCDYCVNHHAEALNYYWKNSSRLTNFINTLDDADISTKLKSAIQYAAKLTESPGDINEFAVNSLKKQGWTDEDILSINLITGYFNFVNRVALGLGVEFSEEEVTGYKY